MSTRYFVTDKETQREITVSSVDLGRFPWGEYYWRAPGGKEHPCDVLSRLDDLPDGGFKQRNYVNNMPIDSYYYYDETNKLVSYHTVYHENRPGGDSYHRTEDMREGRLHVEERWVDHGSEIHQSTNVSKTGDWTSRRDESHPNGTRDHIDAVYHGSTGTLDKHTEHTDANNRTSSQDLRIPDYRDGISEDFWGPLAINDHGSPSGDWDADYDNFADDEAEA
ncbi:hypothetical protein ACIBG8_48945 [Nonomuraea sp. NPDC050556]|uniref:hypothetical protein n=1 Tax=Nonomuraea sp. NPDC050556 TaxID=3364369 RepID=UPI0037B33FE4